MMEVAVGFHTTVLSSEMGLVGVRVGDELPLTFFFAVHACWFCKKKKKILVPGCRALHPLVSGSC